MAAPNILPGALQNALRLTEQAIRAGDMARALQLAADAVANGAAHPNLLTLATYHAMNAGATDKAIAYATEARALAPRSADVLLALGAALSAANRNAEALAAYDAALRQAPGVTAIRYSRARVLENLRDLARAKREFERVLDTEPAHLGALTRLASLAALASDNAAARGYAQRALRVQPTDESALIVLAQADLNERKFEDARTRAADLAGPKTASAVNRAIAQGLMADALDGLGQPAQAFSWYSASNQTLKTHYASQLDVPGTESALDCARRVVRHIRQAPPVAAAPPSEQPVETHVFLVGFPRSGTTLLEQVLASHPAIDALEERDCLAEAETAFLGSDAGLDALARATEEELEPYRDSYWAQVAAGGAPLDKPVFVDKLPLNALLLGVIARLFPNAKILLAIRDPRDVVLSCYRRRFGMSRKMYELLTLDRAAAYYGAIMEICEAARARFPMPVQVTRYEDLVADLEGEARRLCAFLGVAYDAGMQAFTDRARTHVIATPSAAQVARGLYTQGVGQWQAYRGELASVLPQLAPWVAHFGYEA